MSVLYRSIFPVSQKSTYVQNDNVDFVLSLDNEKLVPGTVVLEGKCAIYSDQANTTALNPYDGIYYEPRAGYHGLLRDITTEFRNLGVIENLQNYPRLVKMRAMASTAPESMGTETVNAVEGRVPSKRIAKAYAEGLRAGVQPYVPFSLKLDTVINKASGPLSSQATGQIMLRFRLAPNDEFLFGEDYVAGTSGYVLDGDLKLRYQVVPDDGQLQPVQLERYHSYRAILDSNNQNISTFVPGLADAVHISFIAQADEQNANQNYVLCSPPPGNPPLGWEGTGAASTDDTSVPGSYGVERIYYAVNDTDTALVGFTLESREEIVRNGIRSFNADPKKYADLIRYMRDPTYPDGYVAGIPFGGALDFQNNKFAAEIQTQCSNNNQYITYLYFRMLDMVQA